MKKYIYYYKSNNRIYLVFSTPQFANSLRLFKKIPDNLYPSLWGAITDAMMKPNQIIKVIEYKNNYYEQI